MRWYGNGHGCCLGCGVDILGLVGEVDLAVNGLYDYDWTGSLHFENGDITRLFL